MYNGSLLCGFSVPITGLTCSRPTGETGKAVTRKRIDAVCTVSTLMTRLHGTVVDVNLATVAAESSFTDTSVAVDVIKARSAVETRRLKTFVYLQLTIITCVQVHNAPEST